MTFALATIRHNGQPTPAMEIGADWYSLAEVAPKLLEPSPARGLINVFEHWTESEPMLDEVAYETPGSARSCRSLPAWWSAA